MFAKFQKLDPISVEENRNVRLTIEQVLSGVDELRLSPFGDRICQSFAAENDGKMGFEDFLDMYREVQLDLTPEREPFGTKYSDTLPFSVLNSARPSIIIEIKPYFLQ